MEFDCHNCNKQFTATYLEYVPGFWEVLMGNEKFKYWGCKSCGMNTNMHPCSVCGHWISNRAHTCPKCGDPKAGSFRA